MIGQYVARVAPLVVCLSTRNSKFRVSVYDDVILHSLIIGKRVDVLWLMYKKETTYTRLLVNRSWLSSCLLTDL